MQIGILVIVGIVTVAAFIAAIRLFKGEWGRGHAAQGGASSQPAEELLDRKKQVQLLGMIDRQARAERVQVDRILMTAVSATNSVVDSLLKEVKTAGSKHAEALLATMSEGVKDLVESTSWWDRIGFDADAVTEQMVPIIIKAYQEFVKAELESLVEKLEAVLGESGILRWDFPPTGQESDRRPRENWLKEMAFPFFGGAGVGVGLGVLGAPIAAAVGAALFAVIAILSYKSKEKLHWEIMQKVRPVVEDLFSGEGCRNPDDGTLIPSAVVFVQRQAERLRDATVKRLEDLAEQKRLLIEERSENLKNRCEAGMVPWAVVNDMDRVGAYLRGDVDAI